MKKLIRHILLFLLPLVLLLVLVPVDKRLKYKGLKDDCFNHAIWMYDRLYANPEAVDIAFLGSSRTINGINDHLISDSIGGARAVNFGYCRLGRNLEYVLLKEILGQKVPEKIVIEVRETEDRYSHPIFPFLASDRDVLLPNPFFNRDIVDDIWKHFAYKVELMQDMFYHREDSIRYDLNDWGFASGPDTASYEKLEEYRVRNDRPKAEMSRLASDFHNNFARVYIRKMIKLCRRNGIEIYFLYIPSYGSVDKKPQELAFYENYGKVLLPPPDIFSDKDNWFDDNHLNQAGADKFSSWIASKLNE